MAAALLACLAVALASGIASADTLDVVRSRGVLRWGADQEGGGPYVYPPDDNPSRVAGFEVELADALASELHVRAQHVQGNWERLPDLLRRGDFELLLNGYELTASRIETMRATRPYFRYGLQLMTRAVAPVGWDALREGKRAFRVGVLGGSAAEAVARRLGAPSVEVVAYDGNTDAMRDAEIGRLDATLQDTPIVTFYAHRFPALVTIDAPQEGGVYVGYLRRDDGRLSDAIDAALATLERRGDLLRIYRRYGVESGVPGSGGPLAPADAPRASADSGQPPRPTARHRTPWVQRGVMLSKAAGVTVALSVLSFPLAVLLGLAVAVLRREGPRWLSAALGVAVELIRGTPLLLQLYAIFFLLPHAGVVLPAFATSIAALAINYGAFEAEVFRGAIDAVPSGQSEAALALGLGRWQALRLVTLPQAGRIAIPPAVNDFISLFKDTSVCSIVTVVELTKQYSILHMSTQSTIDLTAMTAALYLAMSWPLAIFARRLEARLDARARRR